MKMIIMYCAISAVALSFAQSNTNKVQFGAKKLSPEEIQQARDLFNKRTGGRIMKPGTQKGEVVYVDCQSAADKSWIRFSADYFAKETKFKVSVKEGKFAFPNPEIQGNVSLFIVDDPKLPNLLAAPENRWAMVNVAPLKCEKSQFFEARVKKELSRGFTYLCGGTNSQFPMSICGGITGAKMLDQYEDHRLAVDIIARFPRSMSSFGITPASIVTYRRACQDGWAPQPTNDFQKAIWDKVHAIPDKPMQIKFDPATQKGKVTK